MPLELEGTLSVRYTDKDSLRFVASIVFRVLASLGNISVRHFTHIFLSLYDYEYLSKEDLKSIENHKFCNDQFLMILYLILKMVYSHALPTKYDAVETNPVNNYIFRPLYYKLGTYIPKSVAPNVITAGTFLLALSQYMILAYYDYYFFADAPGSPEEKRVPNWIWLYSSIGMALSTFFGKTDDDTGYSLS
uniref:Derlin n=1 Tax=Romanomermis culicivorax TaxID=13658 RepID=A0A915IQD8_ROMCU